MLPPLALAVVLEIPSVLPDKELGFGESTEPIPANEAFTYAFSLIEWNSAYSDIQSSLSSPATPMFSNTGDHFFNAFCLSILMCDIFFFIFCFSYIYIVS